LVQRLIEAGNDEADVLDKVVATTAPDQVNAMASQVVSADSTFTESYQIARSQIAGSAAHAGTQATPQNSLPSPRSV
jgi:hypothetical protein